MELSSFISLCFGYFVYSEASTLPPTYGPGCLSPSSCDLPPAKCFVDECYPDPFNCTVYYQCIGTVPQLKACAQNSFVCPATPSNYGSGYECSTICDSNFAGYCAMYIGMCINGTYGPPPHPPLTSPVIPPSSNTPKPATTNTPKSTSSTTPSDGGGGDGGLSSVAIFGIVLLVLLVIFLLLWCILWLCCFRHREPVHPHTTVIVEVPRPIVINPGDHSRPCTPPCKPGGGCEPDHPHHHRPESGCRTPGGVNINMVQAMNIGTMSDMQQPSYNQHTRPGAHPDDVLDLPTGARDTLTPVYDNDDTNIYSCVN